MFLIKSYLQGLLVDILSQFRSLFPMNSLTTAHDIVGIGFELLFQRRIQLFFLNEHNKT